MDKIYIITALIEDNDTYKMQRRILAQDKISCGELYWTTAISNPQILYFNSISHATEFWKSVPRSFRNKEIITEVYVTKIMLYNKEVLS